MPWVNILAANALLKYLSRDSLIPGPLNFTLADHGLHRLFPNFHKMVPGRELGRPEIDVMVNIPISTAISFLTG